MLVKKQSKILQHPSEPETRVTVRLPLSAGDLTGMRTDGDQVGMSLDLMTSLIEAWTYDAPVTAENVQLLDIDTYSWLTQEMFVRSGLRDAVEKKDSNESSSPTSAPAEESSLPSSGT